MKIDFGKLAGNNSADTVIAPREIFGVLPEKAERYQYLRDVQAEVMNQWYEDRDEKDIVIKMNTGGGKTVVGLLILKSCLNEGKGPAVYIAPDSYLVEQVVKEAKDLGISVTTDTGSLSFIRGKSILVINIYKLVNGMSVFGVDQEQRITIGSLLIDDAHACLDTAELQFTLQLASDTEIFRKLLSIFREELCRQSEDKVLDIEAGDKSVNLLVPYWAWIDKIKDVRKLLHEVREDDTVKFVWPLMKNRLHLCNCVFGGDYIEISPKCIPIDNIPSFVNAHRRIFMTATLADDSILVSHFDVGSESITKTITPSTSDDIGDRMIIVPQELNPEISEDQLKAFFKNLSQNHNVVVIVPSMYRATYWADVADETLTASNIHEGVNKLKNGHVGLVVLVNKYDGIDLPKSACRVLVIDGLPDIRRKIDKIEQGMLFGSEEVYSQLVQRIEQGMGRGVRSRDDYCVIFLIGRSLTSHLYVNGVMNKFTPATKAQLELSERLSEQIRWEGLDQIKEVIDHCLNRETEWVKASRGALVHIKYNSTGKINPIAIKSRTAFNSAQIDNYPKAVDIMQEAVNALNNKEQRILRGWLKQQLAEYYHFIDPVTSQEILKSAINDNRQVTKPIEGIQYTKLNKFTEGQAQQCSLYLLDNFSDGNKIILKLHGLIEQLVFLPDTAPTFEQAMKEIASFLGYNGQRPEKEFGRGPDVLWEVGQLKYFVIECKNGVTNNLISKHDCNQLNGSVNWFREKYDATCHYTPVLIHPVNTFEYASSPDSNTRIITKEKLDEFKSALKGFGKALTDSNKYLNAKLVAELIKNFNLERDQFILNYTVDYNTARR